MPSCDTDYCLELLGTLPRKPPLSRISSYAEERRILPSNTPCPGPWRNAMTPYSVEIMDAMGPQSGVEHVAVMKAAQLGLTAAAENVIAYWMDESPTEILYISAIDALLERWALRRLDPLIDSCGYRHKVYAQTANTKSRRSGDRTYLKEYIGGSLCLASAQSASRLRSDSVRVLIRDEVDGSPILLRTGEGDWTEVSSARTDAWGAQKRILDISTPTTFAGSKIYELFLRGDQRRYLVPCPLCGKEQELRLGDEASRSGLRAEKQGGRIVGASYICDHCHEAFGEASKPDILARGSWVPQVSQASPRMRSYHLSSLYSPLGMLSWVTLLERYERARQRGLDGMRSFVNLCLGEPFRESGVRPQLEHVITLRGGYRSGTVPRGVLFLTMAVDVQRGSSRDPENPPRLELEVLGHGQGHRTWSILYRRIEGGIEDPYSGAWEAMHQWALGGGMVFTRGDGEELSPLVTLIDSGDGLTTDIVYLFCERWESCYPSKGYNALKRRKAELGDEVTPKSYLRFRAARVGGGQVLLEVSTNYYKTQLYSSLRIERKPQEEQSPGYADFPLDYPESYFRMLISEERRTDGSYHQIHARNEALDVRVCNLAAADFYLDEEAKRLEHTYRRLGKIPPSRASLIAGIIKKRKNF